MIRKALRVYNNTPMSSRIISAFMYGALFGLVIWGVIVELNLPTTLSENIAFTLRPFGTVLISLLELLIVPFVFFTAAAAVARIDSTDIAGISWRLALWFLATSLLAAGIGIAGALVVGPGAGRLSLDVGALPIKFAHELKEIAGAVPDNPSPADLVTRIFSNPILTGMAGRYLAIIIAALFFGFAIKKQPSDKVSVLFEDICLVLKKVNSWISYYAPVGIFTLTTVIFAAHGGVVFSKFVPVIFAIIICVLVMMYIIYPLLLLIFTRLNPFKVISKLHQTAFTAFAISSQELTLPLAVDVAEKDLGICRETAEYSLPLGLILNNNGLCLMLPFVTITAANTAGQPVEWMTMLIIIVLSPILSFFCIGKNSGLILFTLSLSAMNLPAEAIAAVIALFCGLYPLIRMLDAMLSVTGNMVCTFIVASRTGNVTGDTNG